MFRNDEYIKQFSNFMTEGFIFIDKEGIIQVYNKKAKEIFGLINYEESTYSKGQIEKGDIVIFADNSLGIDDGGIDPKDLKVIGIDDKKIQSKDAVVAVGWYKNNQTPIYKFQSSKEQEDVLSIKAHIDHILIEVTIDFLKKSIVIQIDDKIFPMSYLRAIGHMVVMDSKTKKVKFYQSSGYTARQESVKALLDQKIFGPKGKNISFNVIGKSIFDIHEDETTIREFFSVAKGKQLKYKDQFTYINGFPTLCTLSPVTIKEDRVGACLKVEDLTLLKKLTKERDEALEHMKQVQKEFNEQKNKQDLFSEIIGASNEIEKVKNMAYKASKTHSTILLLGESGTGKTLIAKAIHEISHRKSNPFIHVNCASIPKELLESELFGYEKGAFSGANKEGKIGLFEVAHKGTIFLDEISELAPFLQVKLLKVLQDKTFFRVGGTREITVDVRIIAASNKDLKEYIRKRKFREDLYYRINVFPISIPPLRERKEDIYWLVSRMLPIICEKLGVGRKKISHETFYHLMQYDFPGNVRELENILERAVNIAEEDTIHVSDLLPDDSTENKSKVMSLKEHICEAEKKAIENALKVYNYDRKKVMKILDIKKTSFYEKVKRYGISLKK